MTRKKLIRLGIAAIAILLILGLTAKKAGWIGKEPPLKVAVEKPQKRDVVEMVTANGKIQPETEVKISPDVSGEIVELHVVEGQNVTKGDLLLKIKPDTYKSMRDRADAALNASRAQLENANARLTQAKAQFIQAEQSYARNKKLWESKAISQSEWEAAEATYQVAKADVEAASQSASAARYNVRSSEASLRESEESLRKTSVFAPMNGTISMLLVELGERVTGSELMTGTPMLRVANLDRMEVRVNVNENDIIRISLGDTALIEVDAYLDKKFKGIVTEIANSATVEGSLTDQVTNFEVRILMLRDSYQSMISPKNINPFRPGMSATADIITRRKNKVLSVPIQSVTIRVDSTKIDKNEPKPGEKVTVQQVKDKAAEAKESVFVVREGKATLVAVKTGIQDSNFIEIESGLKPDDQVVIAPYSAISRKLKEGSAVQVVDVKEVFNEK